VVREVTASDHLPSDLHVADASVFPTGITVDPQWTIYALASMAAGCVLAEQEGIALAARQAAE